MRRDATDATLAAYTRSAMLGFKISKSTPDAARLQCLAFLAGTIRDSNPDLSRALAELAGRAFPREKTE